MRLSRACARAGSGMCSITGHRDGDTYDGQPRGTVACNPPPRSARRAARAWPLVAVFSTAGDACELGTQEVAWVLPAFTAVGMVPGGSAKGLRVTPLGYVLSIMAP